MSIESDAVALAYVHNGQTVSYSWHHSLLRQLIYDSRNNRRVVRGGYKTMRGGTDGLGPARNAVVRDFLDGTDKTPWIMFIDTDMGFDPDVIDRLVESADPAERPVMGALTFAQREDEDDRMGGFRPSTWPVILDWTAGGFAVKWTYDHNSVVRCDGTGSACILIHRSVFQRFRDVYGDAFNAWYSRTTNPVSGELLSEDLSFMHRLRELGIPVHVNTAVKTTHHKPVWLSEMDYLHERAVKALVPKAPAVEPATEKVAVIVPVLRRPHNAAPFMESLRQSGTAAELCTVYAVADDGDEATIAAWRDAGATVLVDTLVTFPRKANLGYRATHEPWLFLTGDDVRFHPDWLDQAMHVARQTGANVVGTNDLGNPRVKRGEHAVHMFIRRDYVDTVGAGWDGPGVVCHENLRHWYTDDIIVTAAKQRGTFAPALFSVVEHLHPYWGKSDLDEVYGLPEPHIDADRKLYISLLQANTSPAE